MHDDRDNRRSAVAPRERGRARAARPFNRRVVKGPQTVEAYLRASGPPRYMQRLREIETEFQRQRRRLVAAYSALEAACAHDAELFSRRWRTRVRRWRFDRLNELIREHNEWYPVEAKLAMDPRTRDYVPVLGRSYRRIELGPDWVLAHLPPRPRGEAERPSLPVRAPREPL